MTSENELLPLPKCDVDYTVSYSRAAMQAYARANLSAVSERAERLAEALRMFLAAGVGNSTNFETQFKAAQAARAALTKEDRA